jgi:hypothetical protein
MASAVVPGSEAKNLTANKTAATPVAPLGSAESVPEGLDIGLAASPHTDAGLSPARHITAQVAYGAYSEIRDHSGKLLVETGIASGAILGARRLGLSNRSMLMLAAVPLAAYGLYRGVEAVRKEGISAIPNHILSELSSIHAEAGETAAIELHPNDFSSADLAKADAVLQSIGATAIDNTIPLVTAPGATVLTQQASGAFVRAGDRLAGQLYASMQPLQLAPAFAYATTPESRMISASAGKLGDDVLKSIAGLVVARDGVSAVESSPDGFSDAGSSEHGQAREPMERDASKEAKQSDRAEDKNLTAKEEVELRVQQAQARVAQAKIRVQEAQARMADATTRGEAVSRKLAQTRERQSFAPGRSLDPDHPQDITPQPTSPSGIWPKDEVAREFAGNNIVVSQLKDGRMVVDYASGAREIRTYGANGSIVTLEPDGGRLTWYFENLEKPMFPEQTAYEFDTSEARRFTNEFANGNFVDKTPGRYTNGFASRLPERFAKDFANGERKETVENQFMHWDHTDGSRYVEQYHWVNGRISVERYDLLTDGNRRNL